MSTLIMKITVPPPMDSGRKRLARSRQSTRVTDASHSACSSRGSFAVLSAMPKAST